MFGARSAMVVAVAFGLAACGSSTEPGGPLRVESVTPATLATNVLVTDTVSVLFSKPLLKSSVNDTNIVLSRNGFRVIGTMSVSADGRTISIVPRLGNNQFYVLEVRTGLLGAGGDALAEPYVMAFSTVRADQFTAIDPIGDTYNATIPDVTSITTRQIADTVILSLGFAGTVTPTTSGLPNALTGYIDIDVDQDQSTGSQALTDAFGPVGTNTGLGIEYYVPLFLDAQGTAPVYSISGGFTGLASAVFAGNTVTLKIPLSALGGDDGDLGVAAVVGDPTQPTDIIPNVGHVTVGLSGEVGGSRSPAALHAATARRNAPARAWGR